MRRIVAASWAFPCLLLSFFVSHISANHLTSSKYRLCLVLPPSIRLKLGPKEALRLRHDCERASQGTVFAWEPDVSLGYDICTRVFGAIANGKRSFAKMTMWFPCTTTMDATVVEGLACVLQQNCKRLGLHTAKSFSWPKVPATMMELTWINDYANSISKDDTTTLIGKLENAIGDTEQWVDDTLCRLNLCPYTASLQRAAIGLETAGVSKGPVVVQHSQTKFSIDCRAAALAAAFWEGVTQLANEPQESVATLLIVGPESYDSDFQEFAAVCDELIETSFQAVGACDIVGRAWFHPRYRAASIGHVTILPGHALPACMVEGFVDQYTNSYSHKPNHETIARANDAVRWTPHATINLLRRSQLTAAKQVEAAAANKKPNAVYARNVLRIIEDGTLLS